MTIPIHEPAPQPPPRVLTVHVNGTPAPQGSKRHVGGGRMVESSKAVGPWREAIRHETQTAVEAGGATFPTGPVRLDVWFELRRPAAHLNTAGVARPKAPTFPAVQPDLDKLTRAVADAITQAGALGDDKQIVSLHAFKQYGPHPGARIRLTSLEDAE